MHRDLMREILNQRVAERREEACRASRVRAVRRAARRATLGRRGPIPGR